MRHRFSKCRTGKMNYLIIGDGENFVELLSARIRGGAFYHCHKSFAVNFLYTVSFEPEAFVMDTGVRIRVSRVHKSEAKAAFTSWCARRMRKD